MFKKRAKSVDKIVTWVIIGSAVASIFGLTKTKKWKEITKKTTKKSRSWLVFVWKVLVATLRLFSKKK